MPLSPTYSYELLLLVSDKRSVAAVPGIIWRVRGYIHLNPQITRTMRTSTE